MNQKEDKQALSSKLLNLAERAERVALDIEAYSLLLAKYNEKLRGREK